jgi:hypothetical protein
MKHKPPLTHEEIAFPGVMGTQVTEAFAKGASLFGRSFATMQKESLRFTTQRIEENMKAVEEFGACKTWPDLLAAQQRWFAGMTRAYSEEWQRCGELMNDMAHEASGEASEQQNTPLHTTPSRAAE